MALLPEVIRRAVLAKFGRRTSVETKAAKQLPSLSMYFADPLSNFIADESEPSGDKPIRRLSRHVFACGNAAVVIRYVMPRELALLEDRRFDRIYLLIDDDLESIELSDGLPKDYRKRLIGYREGPYRRLLEMVTDVVAPSENILKTYARKRSVLLDPAQCHEAAGLMHHSMVRPFDIVFAATRSHIQDLGHIAPALADLLHRRPDARLTTFLNGHAPKVLRNLPNAIHLPNMEWSRYRSYVAENRFHVAIAPALDTPFNRARSISKLHDHAALGAAGVYSAQQPFNRVVTHNASGLLLPNNPDEWLHTLLDLAERRDKTLKIAAGGQILSKTLGDIRRVRNFWLQELALL